jgi:hypothetical protein
VVPQRLPAAALVVAAMFAGSGGAEPRRAEELEQLRTHTGYVIEKGELEMDVVPSYFEYEDARLRGIEVELEYGVSDRFMVEIEAPYRWMSFAEGNDVDGLGNLELGAKWLLMDRGVVTAAINVGVELPAGNDRPGIAADLWGVELSAPMSFRFPERDLSLHVEPGVEWQEQEGFEEQILNIAIEHRRGDSNLTLQLGSNVIREEGDVEAYLVPAFEVAAADVPLQFGMGLAVGITSDSADWGVLMDLEVEF